MFYSTDILKKNNGKFGIVWIAAFHGTKAKNMKLSRRDLLRVNICKACIELIHPRVPFSLRLQSNLMLGIVRVYKAQLTFFCNDLKSAWRQLQMSLNAQNLRIIDLDIDKMSKGHFTMADPVMSGDFENFPRDIFTRSPAELFSIRDNEFFTIRGSISPLEITSPTFSSPRSIPSPGADASLLNQAKISDITMPDVEPMKESQLPEEEGFGDELLPHERIALDQTEPEGISATQVTDQSVENAVVHTIDPETGHLTVAPDDEHEINNQAQELYTPLNADIDLSTPEPPRKRRRAGKAIDVVKRLSDERIKKNVLDVSSTLRDPWADRLGRTAVSELFKNPARPELRVEPFLHYWQENAVTRPIADEDVHFALLDRQQDSSDESEDENVIEDPRIEEMLAETSAISHSITSPIRMENTPITPAEVSGQDVSVGLTPEPTTSDKPGESIMSELPQIVEEESFLEIDTDLPMIDEITPPDDFERTLLRDVADKMGFEDETFFHTVIPPNESRRKAAKGFFQLLAWHSTEVVTLEQDGSFENIEIKKGANF